MAIQNPKPAEEEELLALNALVTEGSYVRIDGRSALPEPLQPYASGRSKCTVVASSDFSCSASSIAPEYAPNGPVNLLKNYRYCEHDEEPHFNVDDCVFWEDREGRPWKAHSKDAPDHYKSIVAGTAVSDVWDAFKIPPEEKSGSLAQFREQGAHLDFVDPCPGLRHLRSDTEPEESEGG